MSECCTGVSELLDLSCENLPLLGLLLLSDQTPLPLNTILGVPSRLPSPTFKTKLIKITKFAFPLHFFSLDRNEGVEFFELLSKTAELC